MKEKDLQKFRQVFQEGVRRSGEAMGKKMIEMMRENREKKKHEKARIKFYGRIIEGDTVTIQNKVHTFGRIRLKQVAPALRKTFGDRYRVLGRIYKWKSGKKTLTITITPL